MIKRVVAFGDSWIHGDGLIDQSDSSKESWQYREDNCLVGQLGKLLGIPFRASIINKGLSGGSLQSTQWEFAHWAQSENNFSDTLVLIGLTESSRQSWWRSNHNEANYMHNHHVFPGHGWEDFVKFYQLNSNDPGLWKMNYWLAVEFFSNWCQVNRVPLAMFNVFPAPCNSSHVIQPSWNMRGHLDMLEHTVGNVTAPCKHPNQKGYKLLAEYLFTHLKETKFD